MRAADRPRASRRARIARLFFAVCATAAAAPLGCGGSSTLIDTWRDPTYQLGPSKKMLIIAIKNDALRRRIWEDGFAEGLSRHGVAVTPSYRIFPDTLPDTAQVIEAVQRDGYDGVLVAHRAETDTVNYVVPGYTTTEPVTTYNRWSNLYETHYRRVRHPDYIETETVVRHEVNFWSTKDGGRLIWAGTGEVIDPASSQAVNHEITKRILPELERQGLIPPK